MRRSRKKRHHRKHHVGFSGVTHADKKQKAVGALKESALMLLSGIAGSGIGAALGKHSLIAGLPVTIAGSYFGNKYLLAAGIGLTLSNGFQKPGGQSTNGIEGFDVKRIAQDATERVGTFFDNFKEKLYMTPTLMLPSGQQTAGLGAADEKTAYFINPYTDNEPDMRALDRIDQKLAAMKREDTARTGGFTTQASGGRKTWEDIEHEM